MVTSVFSRFSSFLVVEHAVDAICHRSLKNVSWSPGTPPITAAMWSFFGLSVVHLGSSLLLHSDFHGRRGLKQLTQQRTSILTIEAVVSSMRQTGRLRMFQTLRAWIEHHLEEEIEQPLYIDVVAGWSVYFGAKNLMAYAQLCLVAEAIGR